MQSEDTVTVLASYPINVGKCPLSQHKLPDTMKVRGNDLCDKLMTCVIIRKTLVYVLYGCARRLSLCMYRCVYDMYVYKC